MTCGIYEIVNKDNGKRYIGSSQNIEGRWKRHKRLLGRGKHHSRHLQRSWDKHGKRSFVFSILEQCEERDLIVIEQRRIDTTKPEYNVSPTAGRTAGVVRSEEYIRKQRISQKGKVMSKETRRKISEGMKGKRNSLGTRRVITAETRAKISNTLMGHKISQETRDKIGKKNKGYKHTEEAKRRIGLASIGNKYASKRNE